MSMKQTLVVTTCPFGIKRMVRIYFIRRGLDLAGMACEESLRDSAGLRRFIGVDLGRMPMSDAATVLS